MSAPARILLVHDGDGPLRGSEAVMLALIGATRTQGLNWCVLTNHPEFAAAAAAAGAEAIAMRFRPLFGTARRLVGDAAAALCYVWRARRLLRGRDIDVVHINNGTSCIWSVPLAWWLGRPALVHLHADFSRRNRFRFGIHLADRIVGVSAAVLQGSRCYPSAAGRCRVIYNGIDGLAARRRDRAAARAALGLDEGAFVLGLAAYLIAPKRVDVAIDAMAELPEAVARRAVLLVLGDGPDRAGLEARAAGLPVRFLGHRADVHDLLLNVLDALILSSEMEAFSLVLLEAAAAGLPRIGARAGGNPESILDGEDGLLVPPGDPAALAGAIADLAMQPARARALGEAALARQRREFTQARFIEAFLALYAELRAGPAGRLRRILSGLRAQLALAWPGGQGAEARPPGMSDRGRP